ncbi:PREDICTED: probably inactive leucine-rich repeat receptor-like protein kinase At3g28040 [Ipomoea nil]|uniref:probably inactive leucine-rich repeat receptor-like protein kinase At3g28040 n=1 Tax=Ipomoea nil TaxID=35883 RepID=UPI000900A1E4|nr:PREDICTED: probably inactive leucine-rich repeat receptor-like protein kinase At3g28040 [Ipomoea nil]
MGFRSMLLLVFLSVLSVTSGAGGAESLQLNDDVLGLIVFKSGVQDPASHLATWSEDDDSPCAWNFVKCHPANGRVSEVDLHGLGLSGKIGRGLEKLEHLNVLSLASNNFSGVISPQLGLLTNLQTLNLSKNSISGTVPDSLGNMSSLQFLDLSGNSLSGPVSDSMLENLGSLRFLSLAGSSFEGPIPSSLSKCTLLNHLNLSNNRFSGDPRFSGGIWGLTRLRTLDVSNNELSGSLPIGASFLHNLKELSLGSNHFSGEIPVDLGLCPHLSRLDLSENLFTGTIPESLQRLNSLWFLNLSNNLLDGDFPQWIGSLSSLEYIDLSGNSLKGSLPETLGGLKVLKHLRLNDNKLTGKIPEGVFGIGLEEVDLSRNWLSGSIPPGSGKMVESLEVMDLSGNNLSGDIPPQMGLFSRLRYLNLSWNNFHSRLPPEVVYSQNLTVLDLRNSALIGEIPEDICESGSLGILQLDGNSLTGTIPPQIGNCSSLTLLSLSHNNLSGTIPETLSMLKRLKILKLEVNQLSGEIPQQLGKLENLLAVNVSYNRLTGRLPAGSIFQNLDSSAIEGNDGICSPLLTGPCKMNAPKPIVINPFVYGNQTDNNNGGDNNEPLASTRNSRHHRFLSVSAIVAISAAAIIAVGVMVITMVNASVRRRISFVENALESMCSSTSSRSQGMATGKLILFDTKSSPDWASSTFESVLNKASEIGEGVFGTVYKAPLGGEGSRVVAIKKLTSSKILQYPEDFDREVRVLGKARHQNLVPLRGYYWTPQLQLLVSDFVPLGNLESKLHEMAMAMATPPLTWAVRFKIILGTAKGLAHLHHSCQPPIIHYNIKPSNILLDENLNPKISDFGLARLVAKLDRHVMSNRFQAAIGYVAPELACQSLRVNEKCDVYGFGMLILEIVTGRRPVEYGEDNVLILNDHVRVLLEQGNVLECVDQGMGGYPDEEVLPVLKLALVCTSQIPSSRPSMAEVVQILQVIKTPVPNRMEPY